MENKLSAFVIMPFDKEFNSIYENLIKDPLEAAGYTVLRADSLLDQENILKTIVRGINTADLLIADLTTNNPNVFYELGLAHGLGIPTVLLAQSITDVPFDLRSYKIHIYDTHFNKIDKLKEFLKKIGQQHANKELSFGNPVEDFSEVDHAAESFAQSLPDASDLEAREITPKELWDFIVDGEVAANDMTAILAKLMEENQAITERFKRHSASIDALTKDPTAGSARKFHKVFLLAAADINAFAGRVEAQVSQLENAIDRVNENYSGYIQTVDVSVEGQRQTLMDLRGQLEKLLGIAKEAKGGIGSFKDTSIDLAEKKLSKDLSRASRRQAEALNGVIVNIGRLEAFCVKGMGMIDDKFDTNVH
jgi:hypothetical protein